MKSLLSIIALSILVTSCANVPNEKPASALCSATSNKPQPEWVDNRYHFANSDFVYGYGQKAFSKEYSSDVQYKQAIINARTEIAESLEVRIKNDIEIIEQRSLVNSIETKRSVFNQKVNVNSDQLLTNSQIVDTWQDPSSCTVYALVNMPKATSVLIQKKSLVDALYRQATDENTDLDTRSELLESAINTAKEFEFSTLPNSLSSQELITRHTLEKQDIDRQILSRNNKFSLVKGGHSLVKTPYGLVQYMFTKTKLFIAFPKSDEVTSWAVTFRTSSSTDMNDIQGKTYGLSARGFCPRIRKSLSVSSMCSKLKTKAQVRPKQDFYILSVPISEVLYQGSGVREARLIVESLVPEGKGYRTTYYPEPSPTTYGKKLYGSFGINF